MCQRSQLWSHVTAVGDVQATGETLGERTASQRRKVGQRTVHRGGETAGRPGADLSYEQ